MPEADGGSATSVGGGFDETLQDSVVLVAFSLQSKTAHHFTAVARARGHFSSPRLGHVGREGSDWECGETGSGF